MIKKYHFRFVSLGKFNRIYLRYFVTKQGKPLTMNISCDLSLTNKELKLLNSGEFGGMVQKSCNQIKAKYTQIVEMLNHQNDDYPTPEQIKHYYNVTEKQVQLSYLINKYLMHLHVKPSTRKNYGYCLGQFQKHYESNLKTFPSLQTMVTKNTLNNFEGMLIARKYIDQQTYETDEDNPTIKFAPVSMYNYKGIVLKFLNYVAELYDLKPIEMVLHQPQHSQKWHIGIEDIERLLKYIPIDKFEADIIDIIRFNKDIGLRMSEVLQIQKENIKILSDCIEIRFIESKKNRERTIIVINSEGIEVIKKHLLYDKLWHIKNYQMFDYYIKKIAVEVFKEETTKIYKIDTDKADYVLIKKSLAISSHAFRRFAISQNIVNFGIDVARSYSGHSDYQMIVRHYTGFLQKEDLKKLLLKK